MLSFIFGGNLLFMAIGGVIFFFVGAMCSRLGIFDSVAFLKKLFGNKDVVG